MPHDPALITECLKAFLKLFNLIPRQQKRHETEVRLTISVSIEKPNTIGYFPIWSPCIRAHGLRVVIFVDDHMPAHVHVFGEAKIQLAGAGGVPELFSAAGMTLAEIWRAMQIVKEQQAYLLERWSDIHG